MSLKIGCIADDLTGASDLAGELVAKGMRTVQFTDIPSGELPDDVDALVIGLKSRTAPVEEAVSRTLDAMRWMRKAGAERIYFKYCSTFDSTPQGNIGPVLAALAAEMGVKFSVATPAFPANRRTIYQGHLFVGDRLLNESGMQNHPLTPMTDANLVRVLQAQMDGRVGLIPLADIRADRVAEAAQARMAEGVEVVIADAIDDADLEALGRFCSTLPLSSGASGLGAGIARAIMGREASSAPAVLPALDGGRVVLAGSCSEATRRQVALMREQRPSFQLKLDSARSPADIVAEACTWVDSQDLSRPVLIFSTADPDEVARQRAIEPNASAVLEEMLSDIASHLVAGGVRSLILAGGETSGAIINRLGIDRLRIGPEIDPGVPWTVGSGEGTPELLLALKSGNFGADNFMIKAWDLLP